jgi:hypothetical protein
MHEKPILFGRRRKAAKVPGMRFYRPTLKVQSSTSAIDQVTQIVSSTIHKLNKSITKSKSSVANTPDAYGKKRAALRSRNQNRGEEPQTEVKPVARPKTSLEQV